MHLLPLITLMTPMVHQGGLDSFACKVFIFFTKYKLLPITKWKSAKQIIEVIPPVNMISFLKAIYYTNDL